MPQFERGICQLPTGEQKALNLRGVAGAVVRLCSLPEIQAETKRVAAFVQMFEGL
jgi:hypothetical protein